MVLSNKAVLPVVILVAAFLVAAFHVRSKGSQLSQANMVHMPMIGATPQTEGPWPECLNLSHKECAKLIEENLVEELSRLEIVNVNDAQRCSTDDFEASRVCIFVDDNGVVVKVPHKG